MPLLLSPHTTHSMLGDLSVCELPDWELLAWLPGVVLGGKGSLGVRTPAGGTRQVMSSGVAEGVRWVGGMGGGGAIWMGPGPVADAAAAAAPAAAAAAAAAAPVAARLAPGSREGHEGGAATNAMEAVVPRAGNPTSNVVVNSGWWCPADTRPGNNVAVAAG